MTSARGSQAKQQPKLAQLKCGKCGHEWVPEKVGIAKCPKCSAEHWAYIARK